MSPARGGAGRACCKHLTPLTAPCGWVRDPELQLLLCCRSRQRAALIDAVRAGDGQQRPRERCPHGGDSQGKALVRRCPSHQL